jgi:hypothetical protein
VATWVWREALDLLNRVMPGSTGFLLDQLVGIPANAWRRFRIDDDDGPLGERLVGDVGTALGSDLFVITDASWRPDLGPFVLSSWRLTGLIREHAELTGESFFHGDVVILSPDDGALVALHGAGLVALAHGTPAPRPPEWALAHLTDSKVFSSWPTELEWRHQFGEMYPETAVTLPSGRTVGIRWFETDTQVSFIAPSGDFTISYRGDPDDLDAAYSEFLAVARLDEREVMRLPARPLPS